MSNLNYRPEIDGLRAIAVISVLFYHAGFVFFGDNFLKGGFIGVDIFFVLSGYLITRIIQTEINSTDKFSFVNFYARRARRILPVLLAVILCTTPVACFYMMPSDLKEFANSALSSIFFSSNFYFYFNTTEYGADSALVKPLLHTWSLGVEEQFYIIAPIIALAVHRFFKQHLLSVIFALTLASLLYAEYMHVKDSDFNFYAPFSRFWELSIGFMLAIRELHHKQTAAKGWLQSLLPVLGVAMVFYAIFTFNAATPHPAFQTLIPVLGVALIIAFSSADELVGKILANKLFVWVGLISYSLYMWHFPIFAFARRLTVDLSNLDKLALLMLTFSVSIVSYFIIEKPFRNPKVMSARVFYAAQTVMLLGLVTITAYITYSNGLSQRYSKTQLAVINGLDQVQYKALDHPLGAKGLHYRKNKPTVNCNLRKPSDACRYGKEKIVFLGDSYVGHLEKAFVNNSHDLNLGFISFNYEQCPFLADNLWFGRTPECAEINRQRRAVIRGFKEKKIFIVSANEAYFEAPKLEGEKKIINKKRAWQAYFKAIRWLEKQGHKVVVVRSLPKPSINSSQWLGANAGLIKNMDFPELYNQSDPVKIQALDNKRYATLKSRNIVFIDPVDHLCNEKCYDMLPGLGPMHQKGRHLTYAGATLVSLGIKEKIIKEKWHGNYERLSLK